MTSYPGKLVLVYEHLIIIIIYRGIKPSNTQWLCLNIKRKSLPEIIT